MKRIVWYARGGGVLKAGPFKRHIEAVQAMRLAGSDGPLFHDNVFIWPEEVDGPEPRTFTVLGVYLSDFDRFTDHIEASSWQEAQLKVLEERGDDILVAGVLPGKHTCLDVS